MAADRYSEIVDELICTMSWVDGDAPSPVVFGVDASGAHIVRETVVDLAASEAVTKSAAALAGRRLAVVTAAAVSLAESLPTHAVSEASGPERVQAAVAADRGGESAPDTPVGFGR